MAEVTESKIKITLAMDDLTFGEMEVFEDVTGLVMSDAIKTETVRDPKTGMPLPDPDDPKGRPLKEVKMSVKAMMGLVYISRLREDPNTTFNDIRSIKLSDVELDIQEEDDSEKGKD